MSFYGDPRDGGRRMHEGLDIFASRGTPVVAADDAVVTSVRNRGLGGKTITLRLASSGVTLYYAHLDEQLVSAGQSVARGEIIGKVGNTGNAATTPPHLHLGIYEGSWRQDVDPWDYLVDPPRLRRPPTPHEGLLGGWRRTASEAELRMELPSAAVAPAWRNRAPALRRGGAGESRPVSPDGRDALRGDSPDEAPHDFARPLTIGAGAPVLIVGSSAGLVRVRTAGGLEGVPRTVHPRGSERFLRTARACGRA
jgi:murein DD-endopeptidase MepM/ murein hydrolase activator NlpD